MKIHMKCFGCTANFGEAMDIMNHLRGLGHAIVNAPSGADASIIRTCCVIERTELNMFREMELLRTYGMPVIVTGCLPSVKRDKVLERFPEYHVLSFKDEALMDNILGRIDAILDDPNVREAGSIEKENDKCLGVFTSTIDTLIQSNIITPLANEMTSNEIVVISNGCAGNCSYCITRLARGKLVSYSPESIRIHARKALESGKKEIFITSQDNAVY